MPRARRTPLAGAAAALAAAAVAPAATVPAYGASAPMQVVTARNTFLPAEIVVPAGATLDLTNVDLERHDVVALDIGSNGQPLFRSRTIGPGQRAVVAGVPALEPSVYPYYCSVHAEMVGNLTVL